MYSKKLKRFFKNFVIRQAEIAKQTGCVDECKWICLYYLNGLKLGMIIAEKYDNYVNYFTTESFEYVFRSLVELKKGGV